MRQWIRSLDFSRKIDGVTMTEPDLALQLLRTVRSTDLSNIDSVLVGMRGQLYDVFARS